MLVQRLCDSLRDAAVLLAFDDDRVDDTSAIVDGDEAHEVDGAGLGIDLDHRDVHAVGKRGTVLVDVGARAEMARRSRAPRRPVATIRGSVAARATSNHETMRLGVPATASWPSGVITMSRGIRLE